jgi:hypothetical protein
VDGVDVAVICGRNRSLNRRVSRLAGRAGRGRLTAHGFVGNMADWLRCADIVVGKAGPGTIAEATCCGAPLVLTSFVPGQEKGNAEFVTGSGAGVYAPRPRQLAAEIGRLRRDPGALAAMRAAAVRVSCPGAAADIARFLAELATPTGAGQATHAGAGQDAHAGADGDRTGLAGERALLPALVGGAVARENALIVALTDTADSDRRVRASSSLRRLRRSGVLIRSALRDR